MTEIVEGSSNRPGYGMRKFYSVSTTKADPMILQPALDIFWDVMAIFEKSARIFSSL